MAVRLSAFLISGLLLLGPVTGDLHSFWDTQRLVYAFNGYKSNQKPEKLLLIGEITHVGKERTLEKPGYKLGYDTRSGVATVKVYDGQGLYSGQTLFILRKNPDHENSNHGLKIGQMTVTRVFKSGFAGWMLTGKGHFRNISTGDFVARTMESNTFLAAKKARARGDYHARTGQYGQALASYRKSLELKRDNPEANFALGRLTERDESQYQAARGYYQQAFENIEKISARRERARLLRHYFSNLRRVWRQNIPERDQTLKEMGAIISKAGELFPGSDSFLAEEVEYLYMKNQRQTGGENTVDERLETKLASALKSRPHDPVVLKIYVYYNYEKLRTRFATRREGRALRRKLVARARDFLKLERGVSLEDRRLVHRIIDQLNSGEGVSGF